ncbi:MAG TPA: DUF2628 domain-containing protein [Acetobacteraceae bacterium]|nr:DUF2628 domain-containing protein [Acetobacteraceae bacterium]
MKFWSAHVRTGTPPVLVREGFSWGALFFGPIWLALHRAWIPAAISLAAFVIIGFTTHDIVQAALLVALIVLLGLSGYDLRRWSLDQRGFLLAQVVTGRSELEALTHLLERRPDLKGSFMPPESAR